MEIIIGSEASERVQLTRFSLFKYGLTSRLPSLWTNSYFVATVGSVSLETVKRYIELQKER